MGWIKDRNVAVLANEAREARERGEGVFVTVLHSASLSGATDGDLAVRTEWGRRVCEIEEMGWRLEHWSVLADVKGRPSAYAVFRRSST